MGALLSLQILAFFECKVINSLGLYISRDKRSLVFSMKTKSLPLALLIVAGLLSSTVTANAYINYGNTVVNGTTYNLSPGGYLSGANLSGANLTNADLSWVGWYNVDLTGANLTGANLYFSNLSNVNLTGATVSYLNWDDLLNNSGTLASSTNGLRWYTFDKNLINYVGAGAIPEPSTYGLIGLGALGVAVAARRKKQKSV